MRTRNSLWICGDDLVLIPMEGTALQGMIDRLINVEKCYGKEKNLEKSTIMSSTREPSPIVGQRWPLTQQPSATTLFL
jgi:hypothetical protein